MPVAALDEFQRDYAPAIDRLHAKAGAERWSLSKADFAAVLHRSVAARFAAGHGSGADIERYFESLHAEDLALAAACERGEDAAWHELLGRFGEVIVGAARLIAKDESRANDLANELYAELYGLEERDGRRRSLFSYFHGRSSLRTWLRSVVARNFVNGHRAAKRGESLRDRLVGEMRTEAPAPAEPPDPGRARQAELLGRAFGDALAALSARDRLRLASYYHQGLTLAAVGRMLGEHESTVSRKLEQTRNALRTSIEERLARESGLSAEEVRDCYEAALESGAFDVRKIEQEGRSQTFQA